MRDKIGLQDEKSGEHQQFLTIFQLCLISKNPFNNKSSTNFLSTFPNVTLDTFVILIYINRYEELLNFAWSEGEDSEESNNISDISSVTSPIEGPDIEHFTDCARECGEYKD